MDKYETKLMESIDKNLSDMLVLLKSMTENLDIMAAAVHKGYLGGRPSYFLTGHWDGSAK